MLKREAWGAHSVGGLTLGLGSSHDFGGSWDGAHRQAPCSVVCRLLSLLLPLPPQVPVLSLK